MSLSRREQNHARGLLLAGQRPSTRRSALGVRERAVTDPEPILALRRPGSAVEWAADTRRGHQLQILSPELAWIRPSPVVVGCPSVCRFDHQGHVGLLIYLDICCFNRPFD